MISTRYSRWLKTSAMVAVTLNLVLAPTLSAAAKEGGADMEKDVMQVKFVSHIQAGLPEQDVFIQTGANTDRVWRVEGDAAKDPANLAKTAYASTSAVPHDPFKIGPSPLGPFPKGASLGFNLDQWLAASGSGTYKANGDEAYLKLSFNKLVPNGVYTVWCSRITFPPHFAVVDKPCGNPDGSQNVVHADAQGNARFNLELPPLPASSKETASAVALAYHSDGKTCGGSPCDFGLNSHVQLFSLMPVPKEGEMHKTLDLACVAAAVDKREAAISAGWDAYAAAVKAAYSARRSALAAAWKLTDKKGRRDALRKAWTDWRKADHDARQDWMKAKHDAWQQFRKDRSACGPGAASEAPENEGNDQS